MDLSSSSELALGPISDAELFKYFLNDDLHAGCLSSSSSIPSSPHSPPSPVSSSSTSSTPPLSFSYTQAVPSTSPPSFYESPPLTPESIFSEIDVSFPTIKEEKREHSSPISNPSNNAVSPAKNNKTTRGENRKKTEPSQGSEEERQLKRQRRLVKNRESAQLSRMRKKIYIDDLEGKVNALMSENTSLKDDVVNLQNVIKRLSNGTIDLPRQHLTNSSATTTTPTPTPSSSTSSSSSSSSSTSSGILANISSRHLSGTRCTQAGVYLLVVLFSLGLLFNVAGSANPAARPSSPDHRARREAISFPSPLLASLPTSRLQELHDDMEIAESDFSYSSNTPVSQKRRLSVDLSTDLSSDESADEIITPPNPKRLKIEQPPPNLLFAPETGREVSSVEGGENYEIIPNQFEDRRRPSRDESSPVAIAVVVPSHLSDLDVISSTVFRSVNVHVWPILR